MDENIRQYLATIGEKGGRTSKRHLSQEQAKSMVKVREAKKAFQKYYAQCFWSYKPDLKIAQRDVKWVGEQIMKHGNREAWFVGAKLCQ